MRAQEFDTFALRSYSFAVRKTNSYFSITTLILTAAVLIISVCITFSLISHLWISRQQLPRLESTSIASSGPLTSTLLCYAANDAASSGSVPQAKLFKQNRIQVFYPSISMEQLRKKRPLLAKQITQQYYGCFDIAGFTFSQDSQVIDVDVLAKNVTLYIESMSSSQILKNEEKNFMMLTSVVKGKNYLLQAQIINANILDTLMMNAEPQVTNSFLNVAISDFQRVYPVGKEALYARFRLQLLVQYQAVAVQKYNYNHQTLTVTRLDFGAILGGVLSWVSILGLLCSLLAGPVMEKALQLLQIKALFLLPERLRAPSLLRFLLALFGPFAQLGLFRKERAFLALGERLEQLKDVAKTLKIVRTIRKVTPKATTPETEIIASDQSFAQLKAEENIVALYQTPDARYAPFQTNEDQKHQGIFTRAKAAIFHFLDSGSDPVSISYNGNGHGSKCSLCLTILFALGFLAFLSLFGVFSFNQVVTISNSKNNEQFSYDFSPGQLVFTTRDTTQIMVFLLDGNFNKIQKIPLVNSSDCLIGLTANQISQVNLYGTYFYCFNETVTLTNSLDPSIKTTLYIDNSLVTVSSVYIFHKKANISSKYYSPLDMPIFVSATQSKPTFYYEQLFKLTNFADSSQNTQIYGEMTPVSIVQSIEELAGGINIILSSSQTTIQSNVTTFFDVIQNVWSFAIICFTVLLMKVTKYVNLRQKDKNLGKEKSDFRDSLCVLLSKIDGIMAGRHGKELSRMKYYFKDQLQQ